MIFNIFIYIILFECLIFFFTTMMISIIFFAIIFMFMIEKFDFFFFQNLFLILPELYYKEKGYKISALAPETLAGTTYNKLRIESPTGVVVTNYYNAKSGLLAMKYEDNGNKSFVKDYMELKSQGLVFAGTVNKKFANGIDATFILKETDINENIDDKIFHP